MAVDGTVTTGVDDLLEYLKGKDKVAMQDAASVLGIPLETVQAWVDFLVEEKILGIEYKFTKPFVYLNREDGGKRQKAAPRPVATMESVKAEYLARAAEKRVPASKALSLWKTHVTEALERKQQYFHEQARQRRLANIEALWGRYKADLLSRC